MCGISGKFIFNGAIPDPALIIRMSRTLAHRGPDDEGIYTAPYIGLGQRRHITLEWRYQHNPTLNLWKLFKFCW
jgi:asparagine synthase (glutamine-hydrolysing)